MIERLPAALESISVPKMFSPSSLGSAKGCGLRLAASSLGRNELSSRLPAGPEASVGHLVHRVLERATKESESSAGELFAEEYRKLVADIAADPRRAHFADLSSTKTPAQWANLRAWVLSRASAARHKRLTGRVGAPRGDRGVEGAERSFESPTLRLRGRADLVRRVDRDVFEVRDYKSGSVLDGEGEVKWEIALQLRAYGLLVLEREPRATVRLIVDDGTDRTVEFGPEAQGEAAEMIATVTTAMPLAGVVPAATLARPGSACWGCPVRHVCSAYRAQAPGWWTRYPPELSSAPLDIWGEVLEHRTGESQVVVLRDGASRRVRITGVDGRHGLSDAAGERLSFFGLEATGASRGFDGTRFHPRSFHERPRDALERRAWAMVMYRGEGGT